MAKAKPEVRGGNINIWFDGPTNEAIRSISRKTGESIGEVIKRAVKGWYKIGKVNGK